MMLFIKETNVSESFASLNPFTIIITVRQMKLKLSKAGTYLLWYKCSVCNNKKSKSLATAPF